MNSVERYPRMGGGPLVPGEEVQAALTLIIIFSVMIFLKSKAIFVGVEQNRKQEFHSFQELLDFVPAIFSPSRSAGPLFCTHFLLQIQ